MLVEQQSKGTILLYQPVPFPGDWPPPSRSNQDCEQRWTSIKKSIGDLSGKTMIDVGCANGFFGFRFLQDGGSSVLGVDIDSDVCHFVNELAKEKKMNFICFEKLEDVIGHFDIGIYLDLHFHEGIDFISWLKERVRTLFMSASGDGHINTKILRQELPKFFENIEEVHDGEFGRVIFKCS